MKIIFEKREKFNQAISVLSKTIGGNCFDIGHADMIITFFEKDSFRLGLPELTSAGIYDDFDYSLF